MENLSLEGVLLSIKIISCANNKLGQYTNFEYIPDGYTEKIIVKVIRFVIVISQ